MLKVIKEETYNAVALTYFKPGNCYLTVAEANTKASTMLNADQARELAKALLDWANVGQREA